MLLSEWHPFLVATTSYVEELHIFLMAKSLMCKQTDVTIATGDYQGFIHILFWIKKLLH